MADVINCVCCGVKLGIAFDEGEWALPCPDCARKYPPSLIKACHDPFSYILCLRNGTTFEFSEAEVKGNWVTISSAFPDTALDGKTPDDLPFPRGVDIKLSEIIWCADAPRGS